MRRLIFIRHGEAEEGYSDRHRHLTERGIANLKNTLPILKTYVANKDYKIYSSPITRALETATILSQILDKKFQEVQFLAQGDLRKVILGCEKDINILISHQPFIGDWIYELTGEMVEVKKGSIHIVDLVKDYGYTGKLIKL